MTGLSLEFFLIAFLCQFKKSNWGLGQSPENKSSLHLYFLTTEILVKTNYRFTRVSIINLIS